MYYLNHFSYKNIVKLHYYTSDKSIIFLNITLRAAHISSPLGSISSLGRIHLLLIGFPIRNSIVYVNRDLRTPLYQSSDVPDAGTANKNKSYFLFLHGYLLFFINYDIPGIAHKRWILSTNKKSGNILQCHYKKDTYMPLPFPWLEIFLNALCTRYPQLHLLSLSMNW